MKKVLLLLAVFFLGWFANSAYSAYSFLGIQRPFSFDTAELSSPSDWIKENQIQVSSNNIIIKVPNASWAKFSDTNSMDPLLDAEANSIEIKPVKENLNVGDIISYRSYPIGTIIHRIISIGEDEQGWYCTTKGDNNRYTDPEKVRFEQISGVVVGIIY